MNWLCWLVGHKWDEIPESYIDVCSRCGACPYYNGESDYDSFHIQEIRDALFSIGRKWTDFRFWLSPCSYCGRRFDRHDETCMPF